MPHTTEAPRSALLNQEWCADEHVLESLAKQYASARPFPHVVIDNFLDDDFATQLKDHFPTPHENPQMTWHLYNNPIECKFACNNQSELPSPVATLFELYQSEEFLNLVRRLTSIPNLEQDPHLHGAGVHFHPTGGKLDMHLDYSIHPLSGKERRVNLILYLNDGWKESWGGHIDLYSADRDGEMNACEARVAPLFNRAVLFRTSDLSWHGLPDGVACPIGDGRKSIAVYYVTNPREDATVRYKADFRARPCERDHESEGVRKLRDIRPNRRITKSDVTECVPEWVSPMQEYLATYRLS